MTASARTDVSVMSHTSDQTPSQGDKGKLLSSFSMNSDSIWSKTASVPQESDSFFQESPLLDNPFLHHMGTVSRPGSFTFSPSHHDTQALNPMRTSNAFSAYGTTSQHAFPPFLSCPAAGAGFGVGAGADLSSEPQQPNTASSDSNSRKSLDVPHHSPTAACADAVDSTAHKHVSWLDAHVSADSKGPFLSSMHAAGSLPAGQPAGQSSSLWGPSTLLSVSSAPAPGCAGDLRDQGMRTSWGGVSGGVMARVPGFNTLQDAHEEVSTPLQATMTADCINNLLGSFGSSLFCDSLPATPASRTAARTASKQAPVLPDFVEAWEGPSNLKDTTARLHTAPRSSTTATNTVHASAGVNRAVSSGNGRRSSSGNGSSAFAGLNGAASAAAAAAGMMTHSQSFGVQSDLYRMSQAFAGPHPYPCALNHAYSTPALRHAHGLQHASSIGSLAAGFPATATLAPTHSGAFDPVAISMAAAAAGQCYGYGPLAHMMMPPPLHSTASMPAAQAAAYGNPAALAAAMHAHSMVGDLSGHSAAAQAQFYEAWALAGLSSSGGSSTLHHYHSMGAVGGNSSSGGSSSAGRAAGPWRQSYDSGNNVRGYRKIGSLNSKVDPKSMCGVDPRLCVGSPSDVENEVCRRNPGLAELLRLAPRSVKLINIPVMQDTSPPELLASKRADGPITPDELTLESGLLRHCFGLPSSIGPDLVRAARHAVSRGDETGSGLEPFFWVLQAKLNWLLKRPVFFKGQLLRGEIHAISDKQRAESFAQVTEQRSKLGELLLVLFSMLQPTADGNN